MQHTLIAVFDNRSDAQKAMDDLLASGFSRPNVRLSEGDTGATATTAAATEEEESIGDSIKHFFADLFGSDRGDRTEVYSQAIERGHYVLTVTAPSEPEVERAADLVERYGPTDIDEKATGWGADMGTGAMAAGATSQRAQPMSAQSINQDSLDIQRGTGNAASGLPGATMSGAAMSGLDMTTSMSGGTTAAGLTPSFGSGLGVGGRTAPETRPDSMQYADTESKSIPVVQEELKVGKREVQRGGVRIYSHIVETPVDESVSLREEHVSVQRRAIDKMVDPADVPAFQETSIEMRESAEEPVVEKSARMVEEVVVGKTVTSHEEHVRDTLRHTEVEVEHLSGDDDDSAYRSHWDSNYASAGRAYDEYKPAYSYGSSMRRSELYRGRPWEDVETDLRADWNRSHPGSVWEDFKAAVRHGWERITH
ncbi:MAG: DUF2382 domain-containing protein [Telluria sp.]